MARKDILLYTIVDEADSSQSFNTFNNPTCINYLDNLSLQVIMGKGVKGTLNVFVSNDKVDPKQGQVVTNWQLLDFGKSTYLANFDGALFNLNQASFSFIAVEWLADALSSDPITIKLNARMVGG